MHNPPGLIIVLVLKDVCYLSRIEIEDVITNMPAVPACTEKGSKFSQMLTVRLAASFIKQQQSAFASVSQQLSAFAQIMHPLASGACFKRWLL